MKIVYFDIDCLRPDHLGCYGYHRETSPNIDAIAARGLRFDGVYASDTPCLPSRTALFSGRFGVHTGVVGHGGSGADPAPEGAGRGFNSMIGRTSWPRALRDAGFFTASVSPFAERHGAYHFYAGFNEIINTGRRGLEIADEIGEAAIAWIDRNRHRDRWFLHVNFWDPHTPYRSPASAGDPFAGAPLPPWYTEEIRAAHWQGFGPHSAREPNGFDGAPGPYPVNWPRHPIAIDSMAAARAMFDGYDTGVLHADRWIGAIVSALAGVDDLALLVSADHGENLGELNIYGDHQTADHFTANVPFILAWPGLDRAGELESGLLYQVDLAATIIELAGGAVPGNWDGESVAAALRDRRPATREALVLSQGAWTVQRSARFRAGERELLCIRSYHDGFHGFPEVMLFDLGADPHQQRDLATSEPALVAVGLAMIERWHGDAMRSSTLACDPLWRVLREGGPKHVRGQLEGYLERLRATGRHQAAALLAERHA